MRDMLSWFHRTLVDETVSAFASRAEVREKLDPAIDRLGQTFVGRLTWQTADDIARQQFTDDPSNEQGASNMLAIIRGGGA